MKKSPWLVWENPYCERLPAPDKTIPEGDNSLIFFILVLKGKTFE